MANFIDSIFGAKPEVAPYTSTNLPEEQMNAILANINAMPDITNLGNMYEDYMMSGFENAGLDIGGILKGGSDTTKQMEELSKSFLAGKIPQDVQDKIFRSGAYQNLMAGTQGSPMGGANIARNLGLTSLDLVNQGANLATSAGNAAQRWAGLASGLIMNPSGMMITPQQQAQMTMQNNLYKQATQQLKNNVAAAPDPALQALNQWIEQVGGTVLSAYASGGMSSKGGAGGGGANYKTSYNPSDYLGSSGAPSYVPPPSSAPSYNASAAPTSFNDYPFLPTGGAEGIPAGTYPASSYDFSGSPYTGPWGGSPSAPNYYGVNDFNFTTAGG